MVSRTAVVYRIPIQARIRIGMDIQEYQAKELLADYGVPLATGGVAYSAREASNTAKRIGTPVMVKAQILAGARGPAGAVRLCSNADEVERASDDLLQHGLATAQTGAREFAVHRVYVERALELEREMYFALIIDSNRARVTALIAANGGATLETSPNATIEQVAIEPHADIDDATFGQIAHILNVSAPQRTPLQRCLNACYRAFIELDATLLEINPLALTRAGELVAIDAKMSVDDNALFRQPRIALLRDSDDEGVASRARHGFNYLKLDGNIGCLVNGAGLAMATLDMVVAAGGKPASFLDIPPSATREQITAGFATLIDDNQVDVILINVVGGGITRCDVVAEAAASAVRTARRQLPIVARFEGTNRELGPIILADQGVDFVTAKDFYQAIDHTVTLAKRSRPAS